MRKLMVATLTPIVFGIAACEDITEPGGDPVEVSWTDCPGFVLPTWFAVQDGEGAWQRVGFAGNAYTFTISHGRGGIATYSGELGLSIYYMTTEEMQENLPSCSSARRNVGGSVTGYSSADNVNVFLGFGGVNSTTIFGSEPPPQDFFHTDLAPTTTDLVAVRYQTIASGTTFDQFPSRVFINRSVTGTDAGLVDLSSSTAASAPLLRDVNVANVALGEAIGVNSTLWTASTSAVLASHLNDAANVSGSVIVPLWGLPSTRLVTGETQEMHIEAIKTTASTEDIRVVSELYNDVSDRTVNLGPALSGISFSGGTRPSMTYTVQPSYADWFALGVRQVVSIGGAFGTTAIEVSMTKGYANTSAASVTVAIPNLSGVSQFQPEWGLSAGQTATWTFLAVGGDPAALWQEKPVAYKAAARSQTFTP